MRIIDLETWPRRTHFEVFGSFVQPHFNMCANVDLTAFYPFIKQRNLSFSVAVVYCISHAANAIPEFRYRLHGKQVVEYEVVHPSITLLNDNDLFSFCTLEYGEDFREFNQKAREKMAFIKENPSMQDEREDDVLYMTAIPWVSFTSFMHPLPTQPPDSVPRFAWGKFFKQEDRLLMPLGVQAHHALMDGIHMGKFYVEVGKFLNHPQGMLG